MQVTEKGLVFRLHSKAYRLTVSVASLKHSCLQTRSSVHSALEFFFVDALYKSTFTYLLTSSEELLWIADETFVQADALLSLNKQCQSTEMRD